MHVHVIKFYYLDQPSTIRFDTDRVILIDYHVTINRLSRYYQ